MRGVRGAGTIRLNLELLVWSVRISRHSSIQWDAVPHDFCFRNAIVFAELSNFNVIWSVICLRRTLIEIDWYTLRKTEKKWNENEIEKRRKRKETLEKLWNRRKANEPHFSGNIATEPLCHHPRNECGEFIQKSLCWWWKKGSAKRLVIFSITDFHNVINTMPLFSLAFTAVADSMRIPSLRCFFPWLAPFRKQTNFFSFFSFLNCRSRLLPHPCLCQHNAIRFREPRNMA